MCNNNSHLRLLVVLKFCVQRYNIYFILPNNISYILYYKINTLIRKKGWPFLNAQPSMYNTNLT